MLSNPKLDDIKSSTSKTIQSIKELKKEMKVLTLGDRTPSTLSLVYSAENTIINDQKTTILILSTGECSIRPLSLRHLSALLIPAVTVDSNRKAWLINYPSGTHDSDILKKFEKAIVEQTQGRTDRWETRFAALYSEKKIDRFLVKFNSKFERRSIHGGGGNFNFASSNCSDSINFMLKSFFPVEMAAASKTSKKDNILGFFCTPCFLLTCAASCIPRPVHPRFNNPLYVLAKAKQLNKGNNMIKEFSFDDKQENSCHLCANGCAECGASIVCLMLAITCFPAYALMVPAADFFGRGFFSYSKEAKNDCILAFSSSALLEAPLIHPPKSQVMR